VDNLVDVIRCDARFRGSRRDVQHLPSQPAHLAHAFLLLLVQDGNLVSVGKNLLRARYAIFGVIGVFDALGHFSSRRQRVYRPQGAGVGEGREWVEVARLWVRVRNYFGREDTLENTTL